MGLGMTHTLQRVQGKMEEMEIYIPALPLMEFPTLRMIQPSKVIINNLLIDFKSMAFSPVASNPIIISVKQTSATSVIVEWSQPSGGATVTGYVVHYSDGVTTYATHGSVPTSSTSSSIADLTNCHGYTFMLEAMSEHLSGESYTNEFELGMSI